MPYASHLDLSESVPTGYRYRLIIILAKRTGCHLCSLSKAKIETHFIFRCPSYYEIRGRFCAYLECSFLTAFFMYTDQRCLVLYLREAMQFRDSTL